jgi:hypothetical protein
MTLSEFRSKLEPRLPNPYSRPFVCDGSPLECRLFIVGINSARDSKKPFWSYWCESYGFKKAELIRDLEQLSGGLTRTRKNIEKIADAAGRKITLDTNLYLPPTARAAQLRREDRISDVFEFLLRKIRPQVVFAHGNPAVKFFRKRCPSLVEDWVTPQAVTFDDLQFKLLCSRHLCLVGDQYAKNIGRTLAKTMQFG